MYNLKIRNGKIIDFEKETQTICNIAVKNGKIVCIGQCSEDAEKEIDAKGNIVSPGFIDIHMHEETIGNTIDGDDYDIANKMLSMGVTTCVSGNCGNNRQSIYEFFEFVDRKGAPVNYLSFIGHNYLRNVIGVERYTSATKEEILKMGNLASDAIEKGAIGISFGLEYSPGIKYSEVIDLCNSIKDKDILLSAHYRKDAKYGIDSIKELINISMETGLPMQISHLGSCTAYGMMKESLRVIEEAVKSGVDISADCYPYDAFSTYIGSSVFDDGCFNLWNKSFDSILLTEEPYKGVRCDKDTFYKVRKEYPNMLAVAFVMNEEEVIEALKSPYVMVASDGLYNRGQGHPRGAGTFPRILGKYVRELNALSLTDALKKMTIIPAKRLGLNNKGQIKEGYDADLVIFNPDKIIDTASFDKPTEKSEGISYVIIDGKIALEDNKIENGRLGKIIRKNELSRGGKLYD
ncbi:N-acyl-D-amino-acid deacylase family protein [Maledivibacter halophilus]|uniref:N-acyl-D-amino-acid deacylase n=1 Tax=Maledivibacter halophilus TaxID=36842 RepID=A0A1T5M9Q3_9FIRM|nr:amidohydrolase family protein [Maledivibacter halophilus]SKC84966.1 N-acyl-D-amino-acid deacylase [Maledivibacter halophilus]